GAGRMRQLGSHQTLIIVAPEEVAVGIYRHINPNSEMEPNTAVAIPTVQEIISWVFKNTTDSVLSGVPLWALQGFHFEINQRDPSTRLVKEDWSLESLYSDGLASLPLKHSIRNKALQICGADSRMGSNIPDRICELTDRIGADVYTHVTNHDEECERELQQEEEQEQEREIQIGELCPHEERPWRYHEATVATSCVSLQGQNFMRTVEVPEVADDKVVFEIAEYMRFADAMLFFPSTGEVLLLSDQEGDGVLGAMWSKRRSNPHTRDSTTAQFINIHRLANNGEIRTDGTVMISTATIQDPSQAITSVSQSGIEVAAVRLFNGSHDFGIKETGQYKSLKVLIKDSRCRPSTLRLLEARHLAHNYSCSSLQTSMSGRRNPHRRGRFASARKSSVSVFSSSPSTSTSSSSSSSSSRKKEAWADEEVEEEESPFPDVVADDQMGLYYSRRDNQPRPYLSLLARNMLYRVVLNKIRQLLSEKKPVSFFERDNSNNGMKTLYDKVTCNYVMRSANGKISTITKLTGCEQLAKAFIKHIYKTLNLKEIRQNLAPPYEPFEIELCAEEVAASPDDPRHVQKLVYHWNRQNVKVLDRYLSEWKIVELETLEDTEHVVDENVLSKVEPLYHVETNNDGETVFHSSVLVDGYKNCGIYKWVSEINDCRKDPLNSKSLSLQPDEKPNVRFLELKILGWSYIFIVTIDTIEEGEELLIDYTHSYWRPIKGYKDDYDFVKGLLQPLHSAIPRVVSILPDIPPILRQLADRVISNSENVANALKRIGPSTSVDTVTEHDRSTITSLKESLEKVSGLLLGMTSIIAPVVKALPNGLDTVVNLEDVISVVRILNNSVVTNDGIKEVRRRLGEDVVKSVGEMPSLVESLKLACADFSSTNRGESPEAEDLMVTSMNDSSVDIAGQFQKKRKDKGKALKRSDGDADVTGELFETEIRTQRVEKSGMSDHESNSLLKQRTSNNVYEILKNDDTGENRLHNDESLSADGNEKMVSITCSILGIDDPEDTPPDNISMKFSASRRPPSEPEHEEPMFLLNAALPSTKKRKRTYGSSTSTANLESSSTPELSFTSSQFDPSLTKTTRTVNIRAGFGQGAAPFNQGTFVSSGKYETKMQTSLRLFLLNNKVGNTTTGSLGNGLKEKLHGNSPILSPQKDLSSDFGQPPAKIFESSESLSPILRARNDINRVDCERKNDVPEHPMKEIPRLSSLGPSEEDNNTGDGVVNVESESDMDVDGRNTDEDFFERDTERVELEVVGKSGENMHAGDSEDGRESELVTGPTQGFLDSTSLHERGHGSVDTMPTSSVENGMESEAVTGPTQSVSDSASLHEGSPGSVDTMESTSSVDLGFYVKKRKLYIIDSPIEPPVKSRALTAETGISDPPAISRESLDTHPLPKPLHTIRDNSRIEPNLPPPPTKTTPSSLKRWFSKSHSNATVRPSSPVTSPPSSSNSTSMGGYIGRSAIRQSFLSFIERKKKVLSISSGSDNGGTGSGDSLQSSGAERSLAAEGDNLAFMPSEKTKVQLEHDRDLENCSTQSMPVEDDDGEYDDSDFMVVDKDRTAGGHESIESAEFERTGHDEDEVEYEDGLRQPKQRSQTIEIIRDETSDTNESIIGRDARSSVNFVGLQRSSMSHKRQSSRESPSHTTGESAPSTSDSHESSKSSHSENSFDQFQLGARIPRPHSVESTSTASSKNSGSISTPAQVTQAANYQDGDDDDDIIITGVVKPSAETVDLTIDDDNVGSRPRAVFRQQGRRTQILLQREQQYQRRRQGGRQVTYHIDDDNVEAESIVVDD
ncbi:hypothetical protein HDU76_003298, partial [Blyttiomyces sp. JEL0837]